MTGFSIIPARLAPGRLVGVAVVCALLFLLLGPGVARANVFPINEPFTEQVLPAPWVSGGSAKMTGDGTIDPIGAGWLRLTSAAANQFGYAYYNTAFPSSNGIVISFDYADYGGTGADGLAFFLIDGSYAGAFAPGPTGGSLGYASCPSSSPPGAGLTGAYAGVGFDDYGNFANSGFCGQNGYAAGLQKNRVTVRAGTPGYGYLTSAAATQPLGGTRAALRHMTVVVTPTGVLSVYITYPDGTVQIVTSNFGLPAPPATMKFGFVASTGGSTNFHEIRNSVVAEPVDMQVRVSGPATAPRNSTESYVYTVTNAGPLDTTNATVVADTPGSTMQNVSWTCASSTGTCGAASGSGLPNTTVSLPVGATATYTVTAQDAPATSIASMRLLVNPTGVTAQSVPGDNVALATTNLTPVADTNPSIALTNANGYTGTATGTPGTYRGGGLTITDNWQHCSPTGTGCADIAGATALTYTTGAADRGFTLRLREHVSNGAGAIDAYSALSPLPTTAFTTTPPAITNSTTATFAISSPTAGAAFECELDGAAWSACSSAPTFNGLANGPHTLRARAVYAGLSDGAPASYTWTVDTHVPAAPAITAPVNGSFTNNTKPPISGTTEANATVTVTIDGSVAGSATANGAGAWTYTPTVALSSAAHTVTAKATDQAGTTGPASAADSFTVDTHVPAAPAITAPVNGSFTNNSKPPISGTAEANATVTVTIDGSVVGSVPANGAGAWTYTPTVALSSAAHTVTAKATDAAGTTGPASAADSFTVDTHVPAAPAITAPVNGSFTNNTKPPISGTTEANATVTVTIDGSVAGSATANGAGAWTYTPTVALSSAAHTVTAKATDQAGTAGPASAADSFTVDTHTPAAPAITTPVNGSFTNNSKPPISGTAEANATVNVTIDGSVAGTAAANGAGAWTYTPTVALTSAAHTATATATDQAGTTGPASAADSFTVDTHTPAAPVITAPVNGSFTNNTKPPISGTAEANATVTVTIDGSVVGSVPANGAGAWIYTPTVALSSAAHTATATATDAAGTTGPASAADSFTVDTHTPAAPAITTPVNGSYTNNTKPPISGTAEANATVNVTIDGSVVGSATANNTGGWTYTPTVALSSAAHTATAKATDQAGTTGPASAADNFTVDTHTPAPPIVSTPANGSYTNSDHPVISGSAEPNSTVTITVDGVVVGTVISDNAGGWWSLTLVTALSSGPHTLSTTVTDAAGTTSLASPTTTFTVDTHTPAAPVISVPADGAYTNNTTPTIGGTAEANSTVYVSIDGTLAGTASSGASGNWSMIPGGLSSGSHTATATATDQAGTTSPASSTDHFTIDTHTPAAPVITAPANGSYTNNTQPPITGTTEPNATVTITIDGSVVGSAAANGAGAWTYTPTVALSSAAHTVTAKATDQAGTTGPASAADSFTVDTHVPAAPAITAPVNGSFTNNAQPPITGTAEANATVTVTIDGSVVGSAAANGAGAWTYTPTVTLTSAAHTATATATDAAGTTGPASAADSFTVDTHTPAAPAITAPADGSFTNNSKPPISGTTEANATVNVTIDGSVAGTAAANGAGAWTYTPTVALTSAAHTATATATDQAGTTGPASAADSFTVDTHTPAAPVITAPVNGSFTNNTKPPISGTAEANATVTVTIDGSLAGTATADNTGAWIYTPTVALSSAAHTATATATDAAGTTGPASAADSFTVDTHTPAAPAITTPVNGSYTNNTKPPISGTAEANATVNVTIDGSVVGSATANNTGGWTYTPTVALSSAAHTATAKATDQAGTTGPASAADNFTVDTHTPAPPIVSTPANGSYTNSDHPVISGSAEPNSTVTITVDGVVVGTVISDNAGGWWSLTLVTALSSGPHTLSTTVTDAAGTTSLASPTTTFTVDTHTPAAPVISVPADGAYTNNTTPTIGGTAEANSTVYVSIDGTLAGTASSGASGNWSMIPGGLSSGSHTATATATDQAGTTSPASSTDHFTIDTHTPAAPVITAPANGSYTNNTQPPITGTTEPNATVTITIDGTLAGTATADNTGAWTFAPFAPLTSAAHTATATATDAAGTTGPASATDSFTVDTHTPAAPAITAPADGSFTNNTQPPISGTAEANATVNVTFDGSVVGSAAANGAGAWTYTPTVALSSAAHTVTATATDAAGTTGPASATDSFTVDSHTPAAPEITAPADGSFTNNSKPPISGTAEANATVNVTIDGSVVGSAAANGAGAWTYTPTVALTSAAHTATATATDQAGTTGPASAADNFTVDTHVPAAPVITAPASGSFTNNTQPPISGTTEANATVTITIDGSLAGTATADNTGAWTFAPFAALTSAAHTATATATDAAGTTGPASAADSFTVDTHTPAAPVITVPVNGSYTNDSKPPISGTAEANATVTVTIDGSVVGSATANNTGAWTYTPTVALSSAAHTATATATDAAGTTGLASAADTFTVDTHTPAAPVITAPADGSITNSSRPPITGTAEPRSMVNVFIDGTPVGTATAAVSGAWAFTPSALPDGPHLVAASQTDRAQTTGARSTAVSVTVDTHTPAPPTISTPPNGSYTANTKPPIAGNAEANATVNVAIDGAAAGTATANNSGAWTFTPSSALSAGAHTVTATATDRAGTTSAPSGSDIFNIDPNSPAPPAITSPADGSYTSNAKPPISGTAVAGSTVNVTIDGAPAGTTPADGAGAWTFVPTAALSSVAAHTVTATVTNLAGLTSVPSTTDTFTVDTHVPPRPLITAPGDGSYTSNPRVAITGRAESAANVQILIDGASAGTVTADAAGDWTLTPASALADGPHTVSATQTDRALTTSAPSLTTHFSVDAHTPAAPQFSSPANGSQTSNPRPTLRGTAEAGATVTVSDGATVLGSTVADGSGGWSLTSAAALSEGQHDFTATQTDAAGTSGPPTPTPWRLSIDSHVPPAPTLVHTPPAVSPDAAGTVTFTGESGATFACSLDGAAAVACASPFTYGGLGAGQHTFVVSQSDAAGTASPVAMVRWTIDNGPPAPAVVSAPATVSSSSDFTFAPSPGDTLQCALDGGAFTTCGSSFSPSGLPDGDHVVQVRQVNANGQISPVHTLGWRLLTTPPGPPTVISGPIGPAPATTAEFQFVGASPGGSFECHLDGAPWTACVTGQTYDRLPLGPHAFYVHQIDDAGNVGAPTVQRFDVGAHDPLRATKVWTVVATRPEAVGGVLPIGCRLDHGSLKSCTITVYSLGRHGRRSLVGVGRVTVGAAGLPLAGVNVAVNRTGQRLLKHTLAGVRVVFISAARSFGSPRLLKGYNAGRMFPPTRRVLPTDGLFNSNSSRLLPVGQRFIVHLAAALQIVQSIVCVGHTDDTGSIAYNYHLGLRRARAVCQALVARPQLHGVPIAVRSYGKQRPRARNSSARGRHLNRFVEIVVAYRNLN